MTQPKYPIVKPYLPNQEKYQQYIDNIFDRNWLTNSGPLVSLLEQRLAEYLGVKHLLLVANGTLALQVAYAVLGLKGHVLTTPFSFAATASSLCWQQLKPIFVDIDEQSLNFLIDNVSDADAELASALLAVHVFGNPCEVEEISTFAKKYNLPVIYDAAHALASNFSQQSVLSFGDISTLSLHATKLFHSVEGGAIIFKEEEAYLKAKKMINFGFDADNHPEFVGINAKMSEVHAGMGLAVLDDIEYIIEKRKLLTIRYHELLTGCSAITLQQWHQNSECSGAYMPVIFSSEAQLLNVMELLQVKGIQTRRYFYPSLSQVEVYGQRGETPIANAISERILCLPLYTDLAITDVDYICNVLLDVMNK